MRKLGVAMMVLALTALAGTPARAQFGIHGGINLTRFVGGDAEDVDSKQGMNFGGSMRLFQIGPISIVPEVFYSQKGATFDDPASSLAQRFEYSVDYLEVPVMAKLTLPSMGPLLPYVAAGPAFAWKLDCSVSLISGNAAQEAQDCGEQFGSAKTALRDADRGLVVSGGIDLPVLGIGALNLDARLVQGLARLSESEGTTSEPDVKNQVFSLILGYSFGM
jgi:hypothetical protein